MQKPKYIAAINACTFLPKDLRAIFLESADELTADERESIVRTIREGAGLFIKSVEESLRTLAGLERKVNRCFREHLENEDRNTNPLPTFDNANS
jgi:hypothetical protein